MLKRRMSAERFPSGRAGRIAAWVLFFFLAAPGAASALVSVERSLPAEYAPGAVFDYTLAVTVDPVDRPNAFIVAEVLPDGWLLEASDPPAFPPGEGEPNAWRWLFGATGQPVADRVITLTVAVPPGAGGAQVFSGGATYYFVGEEFFRATTGPDETVPSFPGYAFTPPELDFGRADTIRALTLANTGGAPLDWQVASSRPWLWVTPSSGTALAPGGQAVLTVSVERAGLASGAYSGSLEFTVAGQESRLPVSMVVGRPAPVENLQAYASLERAALYWENPENHAGVIVFRKAGAPMGPGDEPEPGRDYAVDGAYNPDNLPTAAGGALCVFKDATGRDYFLDNRVTPGVRYYYRVYGFSPSAATGGTSYSEARGDSVVPGASLGGYHFMPGVPLGDIYPDGGEGFGLENLPGDAFPVPLDLRLGMAEAGAGPPAPVTVTPFRRFFAVSGRDPEIALEEGRVITLRFPVAGADLDAAGVARIEDIHLYQWLRRWQDGEGPGWRRVEDIDRVTGVPGYDAGYITAGVSDFSGDAYFALGALVSVPGTDSGCFIATAAWGTPLAPEVDNLRRFRDRVLLRFDWGRRFVAGYYRCSPPAAAFIRPRPGWRFAARLALRPLVAVARLFS